MRTSTFPILLITSNVKPRVASSVPFRQCARPNFNPDITDWQQRPVARSDEPPVTDTCQVLSWLSEKASNAMLKLHQQLNKIVEMLAIQRKKSSLTQPQVSLFDDSCLNYELFQTAQFRVPCFASHTWSRIQCTSSNPATNLRVIRQFQNFFFFVAWILNFYVGKFLFKFIHFYSPIIWHSPPIKARANFTFCTFVWKDYTVMSIFHSK